MIVQQVVGQRETPGRAESGDHRRVIVGADTRLGPAELVGRPGARFPVGGHDPAHRQHQPVARAARRADPGPVDPDPAIERQAPGHVARNAGAAPSGELGHQDAGMTRADAPVKGPPGVSRRRREQRFEPRRLDVGALQRFHDELARCHVVVAERPVCRGEGHRMDDDPDADQITGDQAAKETKHLGTARFGRLALPEDG